MRHGKKALTQGVAKGEKAFFFLRVVKIALRRGKRVIENCQRLLEGYAVFALIALVFSFVPFKVYARRLLSQFRRLRRFPLLYHETGGRQNALSEKLNRVLRKYRVGA